MENFFHLSTLHKHCRRRDQTRPAASFAAIAFYFTYPRSARAVRSRVVLRSLSDMPLADERELRVALVSVEVL
jgi:hypothetical protein